jgi:hypothetical protein
VESAALEKTGETEYESASIIRPEETEETLSARLVSKKHHHKASTEASAKTLSGRLVKSEES